MAVVRMSRIGICGLKKDRKAVLELLQILGQVEIDTHERKDQVLETQGLEQTDTSGQRMVFRKQADMAEAALQVLQRYVPEKTSVFTALKGKLPAEGDLYGKGARFGEYYIGEGRKILEADQRILELEGADSKLEQETEGLRPWMALGIPMNFRGTEKTALLLGTLPGERQENVLENWLRHMLSGKQEGVHVRIISGSRDLTCLAVLVRREREEEVQELLRTEGFVRMMWTDELTPEEKKRKLEMDIRENQRLIRDYCKRIREMAGKREDLKRMADYFRIRAEKYRVLGELPQSKNTFFISGYVPEAAADQVARRIAGRFHVQVELSPVEKGEEGPVLLKNGSFSSSAQGVLEAFGLPGRGETDPTAVMAVFYVVLFGMMLADAAYGLITAAVCKTLLKKFPGMGKEIRESLKLFFWCGISTLIWGVLFGSYFGDALDVAAEAFFGVRLPEGKSLLPALWFVPLEHPMKMLLYAMLFGMIHLLAGLAMKGYLYLREKRYMDFLSQVVCWFLLLAGLMILLLPSGLFQSVSQTRIVFPEPVMGAGKVMAAGGALGILLFSGRTAENPLLGLALGAYELYGITGWVSDVLSYSRLLALGLATGVIASVINQMGVMLGPVGFVPVFLTGHLMNLAINLLGAYVHTCRLQYVEFFGKFYQGGGRAFRPFAADTKYVEIKEEIQK